MDLIFATVLLIILIKIAKIVGIKEADARREFNKKWKK